MRHFILSELGMKAFLPVLSFDLPVARGLFEGLSNLALVSLCVLMVALRSSISFNLEMIFFRKFV